MAFKGSGYGTVASGKGSDLQLREEQSSSGSGLASVPSVRMVSCRRSISSSVNAAPPNSWSTGQHQLPSKQRRCWVPDLHRQFVDALEKLGGPQGRTRVKCDSRSNVFNSNDSSCFVLVILSCFQYRFHLITLTSRNVCSCHPEADQRTDAGGWTDKRWSQEPSAGQFQLLKSPTSSSI